MKIKKSIAVTGTPGVGKTILSKELGRILDIPVIHLGEVVLRPELRKDLVIEVDPKRDSLIINPQSLKEWIRREVSTIGGSIIESHFTDLIPPDLLSHCIILRTHPFVLETRLAHRKWSLKKINENIQSEILGNCVNDVIQAFKDQKVILHELDTSTKKPKTQIQSIIDCLQKRRCVPPKINWLQLLSTKQLKKYFQY